MNWNTNLESFLSKNEEKIITILDNKANIEFINQKFLNTFKIPSKENVIGQNIFEFGTKYEKFQTIRIWKTISEGLIWEGEIKTANINNEELFLNASIIPIDNKRIIIVADDITHEKVVEKKIKEAEQKNIILLSALPDTLFVLNKQGVIIQNKTEQNNDFFIDENLINKKISEINLPVDLSQKLLNAVQFTLKSKKNKQFNYDYKQTDKHFECRIIAFNEKEALCIIRDITKRIVVEKILKNREKSYKSMVDNFPSGLIIQKNNRLYYANKTALGYLGCKSLNELRKYNIFDLLPEDKRELSRQRVLKALEGKNVPFMEFPILKIDTNKYIMYETKPVLFDYYGEKVCQIVIRDLSIQKRLIKEKLRAELAEKMNIELKQEMLIRKSAEDNLKNSLHEKEELIKEIHHRVKNNMQVMTSILNLQKNMLEDDKMKKILEESQNRIKSMSLVHENIYANKSLTKIDFEKYIKSLVDNLIRNHDISQKNIEIKLKIKNFHLPVTLAVPCGLMINEIISYSINKIFVEISKNILIFVEVNLKNNEVQIQISDNGMPINDKKLLSEPTSLSFQLVNALIDQLNGRISLNTDKQNKFSIFFNI